MEPREPHQLVHQLRRIRRRRWAMGFVFLLLPVALLVHCYAPWSRPLRNALLLGWVAVYAATTLRLAWSHCPRCRAFFFVGTTFFQVNPLRRRCGNCGGRDRI